MAAAAAAVVVAVVAMVVVGGGGGGRWRCHEPPDSRGNVAWFAYPYRDTPDDDNCVTSRLKGAGLG